jgi:glycosyltransferase involved in cell wall biosynthesis
MISNQRPRVSVLTPVYNGEPYLRECIESVLAQTYEHWDYTIINNCSTDRTLETAREYAARDSRIHVVCNDAFVRVIANHNIAFRQISPESKYCKVVAADDMLLPECLEKMVRLAEGFPNVAIVGAYGLYSRAEMGVYCRGVPYSTNVLPGRQLGRSYLLGQGPAVFGPPTFVLFRSNLVRSRKAFYNESHLQADSEACLELMEHHDFGFVHQVLTFTRIQEESLSSVSKRLNTYLPYQLYALTKYGPKYLSEEELKQQIHKCLCEYYSYLGWQVTKRHGVEFWKFHQGKLAAIGYPLSNVRVAASTFSYILDLVLNPKRTAEKAVHRFAKAGREHEGSNGLYDT